MMGKEKFYYVALDDFEHGMVIRALNEVKTEWMAQGRSTDNVDDLIVKIGTAPQKKCKVLDRER